MDRKEMLELLSEIAQSSYVYGDAEQDLLNFISDLLDEEEELE